MMSTREMAYDLIDQLDEKQLNAIVEVLKIISISPHTETSSVEEDAQKRRDKAFEQIMRMRKKVPDFNEKEELAAYREERFGG